MNEYTIKAVGSKVKPWSSQYGEFKTYLIQVEGNGEPVQLNKKADSEPPKEGDVIYGKIEETEFGQKFKAAKKPFSGGYQRDDSAIRAQWAIGQAVGTVDWTQKGVAIYEAVEQRAKELYAMVNRVKDSDKDAS